jgi:hypothetical protein
MPVITSTKPGSATRPLSGILAEVVNEHDGKPIDEGQGLLVLKRPWPSMLRTLYKEDDRFIEVYFKRFGNDTSSVTPWTGRRCPHRSRRTVLTKRNRWWVWLVITVFACRTSRNHHSITSLPEPRSNSSSGRPMHIRGHIRRRHSR